MIHVQRYQVPSQQNLAFFSGGSASFFTGVVAGTDGNSLRRWNSGLEGLPGIVDSWTFHLSSFLLTRSFVVDSGCSVSENQLHGAPGEDVLNGPMNTFGVDVLEPVVLGQPLPTALLARPAVWQALELDDDVVLLLDDLLGVLCGQHHTLLLVVRVLCILHSALALRRVLTVLTILLQRFIHVDVLLHERHSQNYTEFT